MTYIFCTKVYRQLWRWISIYSTSAKGLAIEELEMLMVPGRFIIIDQSYSATPIGHVDKYPTTH